MAAVNTLFSRFSGGLRSYLRGGIWRTTRRAARLRAGGFAARVPVMGAAAATDVAALLAGTTMKAGIRAAGWAGRHPFAAATTGISAFGAVGAMKGMHTAGRSIQQLAVPPTNLPVPPVRGPGYNVWGSPSKGPMSPSNLGATGDLTLSLHRVRHK